MLIIVKKLSVKSVQKFKLQLSYTNLILISWPCKNY